MPIPTETATSPGETLTAEDIDDAAAANDAQGSVESEDVASEDVASEDPGGEPESKDSAPAKKKRRIRWSRAVAFGVLPGLALVLASVAGFLKWQDGSARASQIAGVECLAAAKDSTVALLSYQPDTVEKDLGAGLDRLTGTFKTSYAQLTHDVVIPGAKQRRISATATVPAVALVSATPKHAVALVFVDQTVVVGTGAPTDSASSVRVSLDKIGDRWLVSAFDPI